MEGEKRERKRESVSEEVEGGRKKEGGRKEYNNIMKTAAKLQQ